MRATVRAFAATLPVLALPAIAIAQVRDAAVPTVSRDAGTGAASPSDERRSMRDLECPKRAQRPIHWLVFSDNGPECLDTKAMAAVTTCAGAPCRLGAQEDATVSARLEWSSPMETFDWVPLTGLRDSAGRLCADGFVQSTATFSFEASGREAAESAMIGLWSDSPGTFALYARTSDGQWCCDMSISNRVQCGASARACVQVPIDARSTRLIQLWIGSLEEVWIRGGGSEPSSPMATRPIQDSCSVEVKVTRRADAGQGP
jgi:hypothetical protein